MRRFAPLLVAAVVGAAVPDARPCDDCVAGVANFGRVDDALWRGAQPTAAGFQALAALGVRTVVNLRHDHDDAALLAGTGLRQVRIRCRAWRPRTAQMAAFLAVVRDPANQPVFVHCAQGRDRTGYMVAAYRMAAQGWTAEAAIRDMEAFRFNHLWMGNPGFLRHLDLGSLAPAAGPPL